jgi:hypothetical protein
MQRDVSHVLFLRILILSSLFFLEEHFEFYLQNTQNAYVGFEWLR